MAPRRSRAVFPISGSSIGTGCPCSPARPFPTRNPPLCSPLSRRRTWLEVPPAGLWSLSALSWASPRGDQMCRPAGRGFPGARALPIDVLKQASLQLCEGRPPSGHLNCRPSPETCTSSSLPLLCLSALLLSPTNMWHVHLPLYISHFKKSFLFSFTLFSVFPSFPPS